MATMLVSFQSPGRMPISKDLLNNMVKDGWVEFTNTEAKSSLWLRSRTKKKNKTKKNKDKKPLSNPIRP